MQAWWCLRHSPYNPWLSKLLFQYMVTLLVLFASFYVRKYVSPAKKGGKKAPASHSDATAASAGNGSPPAMRTRARRAQ